jgi:UDP-N-acetylglucosamine pyrophosphorylase
MHLKNKNSSFQLALKRIIEESYFLKRQHDFIIYTSVFYDLNLILLFTKQKKKIKKNQTFKQNVYICLHSRKYYNFFYIFLL